MPVIKFVLGVRDKHQGLLPFNTRAVSKHNNSV